MSARQVMPYEVEVEATDWREWRSGVAVSLFVHTVVLFVLGVIMIPTECFREALTIISHTSPDDATIDFDTVEIQELTFEHAKRLDTEAEGSAVPADTNEDPFFADAIETPIVDPRPFAQEFNDPDAGEMPDLTHFHMAPLGSGNGDDPNADDIGAEIKFYGVRASGRRFVFVTDCSGSMQGPPLQRLKEQLRESISALPPNAEFSIIFFNHSAIPMPSAACVRATPQHVRTYLEWADTIQNDGGTDPSQALDAALALKPSVVFLLTDGIFQPGPTLEVIERHNKDRKVRIHTIAIGERGAEPVLRRIAAENKGTFTFVPNQ